ncbi:hypothetical protein [Thermoleptolyngbya sp.]
MLLSEPQSEVVLDLGHSLRFREVSGGDRREMSALGDEGRSPKGIATGR